MLRGTSEPNSEETETVSHPLPRNRRSKRSRLTLSSAPAVDWGGGSPSVRCVRSVVPADVAVMHVPLGMDGYPAALHPKTPRILSCLVLHVSRHLSHSLDRCGVSHRPQYLLFPIGKRQAQSQSFTPMWGRNPHKAFFANTPLVTAEAARATASSRKLACMFFGKKGRSCTD